MLDSKENRLSSSAGQRTRRVADYPATRCFVDACVARCLSPVVAALPHHVYEFAQRSDASLYSRPCLFILCYLSHMYFFCSQDSAGQQACRVQCTNDHLRCVSVQSTHTHCDVVQVMRAFCFPWMCTHRHTSITRGREILLRFHAMTSINMFDSIHRFQGVLFGVVKLWICAVWMTSC